jgi:hypothetical protein
VPGVPTSYLIDRNGQVIGNGVGMVNWEEGPFTALIESLLGPPRQSQMVAQNSAAFSDIARQGPVANPTVRQAGPRRTIETRSGVTTDRKPTAGPPLPDGSDALQLQDPASTKTSSDSATAREPAPIPKNLKTKRGRAGTQELQGTKPKPRKKRQAVKKSLNPTAEFGKPKPFHSLPQAGGTAEEVKPASRYLAQGNPGTPLPKPYVPPRTGAPTPYSPPRTGAPTPPPPLGQTVRPGLPAAMPYTPPNMSSAPRPTARPVAPDENGQVMARIPSRYSPPAGEEAEPPKQAAGSGGWPIARPRIPANPIDTFILDSFEKDASSRQATPQALYPPPDQDRNQGRAQYQPQQQEPAPASSILGQLSSDVRNLGEGIRQTFSGWLPGK